MHSGQFWGASHAWTPLMHNNSKLYSNVPIYFIKVFSHLFDSYQNPEAKGDSGDMTTKCDVVFEVDVKTQREYYGGTSERCKQSGIRE